VVFLSLTRQIAPRLGHNRRLPYNYFLVNRSSVILPFDAVCSVATGSVRKKSHRHHWQNSPYLAVAFLRSFCQSWFGFHFFGFRNSNCFTEQGRQPFVLPRIWGTRSLYLCPPQGGPVMRPGTGFHFRRLLRLSGLRWRHSNPPPHGKKKSQEIYYFTIRRV
jgi:hypothetical protein